MPVVNPVVPVPAGPVGPVAPCGWTVDVSCCSDWSSFTNTVRDRATAWATQILWALSGRQFGTCAVTVRPCGGNCRFYGGWVTYPVTADGVGTVWTPFVRDGVWFNCACSGVCTCRASCSVWLPGPVSQVDEVIVDGVIIDPSLYRVDNRELLVGVNGQCWPECQNLDLNSPAAGTFEVTYQRGTPLPMAGQIAAGIMACEFAKACAGGNCALPEQISTLVRQGVEVTMVNPTDVLNKGLTGIAEVDLWLRSVNPNQRAKRARVFSPDMHYPAQRTS